MLQYRCVQLTVATLTLPLLGQKRCSQRSSTERLCDSLVGCSSHCPAFFATSMTDLHPKLSLKIAGDRTVVQYASQILPVVFIHWSFKKTNSRPASHAAGKRGFAPQNSWKHWCRLLAKRLLESRSGMGIPQFVSENWGLPIPDQIAWHATATMSFASAVPPWHCRFFVKKRCSQGSSSKRWSHNIHPASRGGAAHTAGFFGQLKHIYKNSGKNIIFFSVFTMCSVENTVIYAVFGIKSVQNNGFCSVFKALASKQVQCRDLPKPLKKPLFTLFSSIFPCANAAGQLKHIYKKSFKNIVFFSVFTFFSVKNAVIYTFFGLKSVQHTGFCSVFNALASKNHSKYRYLQCFFISVRFSLAGSRPKWPKIPFQYPLKLRHPKIVEKTRKHHQYEVSVRNRFWPPSPQLKLI